MMKPSEVMKMRDELVSQLFNIFDDSFRLDHDGQELADWLIEKGWVAEVPGEDTN